MLHNRNIVSLNFPLALTDCDHSDSVKQLTKMGYLGSDNVVIELYFYNY